MKMTHNELKAALIGARLLDAAYPRLQSKKELGRYEQQIAESYEIDDSGVYYIPADARGLQNLGAVMWENAKQRRALKLDALEKALKSPGYFEPLCHVIQ